MHNSLLGSRDFVMRIRPLIIESSDRADETVNLAILSGDRALFVSQIESGNMFRKVAPLRGLPPLHECCAEEALLSALNAEGCNHLIDRLTYDMFADKTHQSKSPPTEEIEWIIEQGRSYDREEQFEETQCVAAAIFCNIGALMCVFSIRGPSVRISEERLVGHGDTAPRTANRVIQRLRCVSPSHWAKYD